MPRPRPIPAPPILNGRIGSRQGWRSLGGRPYRWHNGVDIGHPEGTPILAIAPGIIDSVWSSGTPGVRGYGNVIVIKHGPAFYSVYCHCLTTRQDVGAYVQTGEQIATVGRTAGTGGDPATIWTVPHLHLEIVKRWPLRADDYESRYDVVSTLEALGIDTRERLVWRTGSSTAPRPNALNTPPHASLTPVLIVAILGAYILRERGIL